MSRRRTEPLVLLLTFGVGAGLGLDALVRAALAASFPFDLNFWSEDYFMTSMLRLARGLPTYAPLADASSSIYAPGGPWLHHALLAPFGLSTSVLANRWLSQLAVLGAVLFGVLAAIELARRYGVWRRGRVAITGVSLTTLVLAIYANPVAVSLHPVAHESLVLAATLYALVGWDRRCPRTRLVLALLLPALGLLAKQSAGPAVALALTLAGGRSRVSVAAWLSVGVTALALHLTTAGNFTLWGFSLLAAQGLEGGGKITDALSSVVVRFAPALLVPIAFAVRALRRRSDADRAWLRAALVPLTYAPAAIGAFAKALGGENNLAALGFFASIVAIAALVVLAFEARWGGVAAALLVAQIVLLHPQRRVPTSFDIANAERICGYASARMACGERVLLGRGTSCYGTYAVPLDRMVNVHEAWVGGRAAELGTWGRIERGDYDLVLVHQSDLHRFGRTLWPLLSARYRAFFSTPQGKPGDFWTNGWQGYASSRMLFFEKKERAGEHALERRACTE